MKFAFAILFSLLFLNQNAFSQDYSKMSANEKAKVIIYGNDYPYSLLLESGSDTLSVYEALENKHLKLIFEEGKLAETEDKEIISKYFYEGKRIARIQTIHKGGDTVFSTPIYRNDSLIEIIISRKMIDFSSSNNSHLKESDSSFYTSYNYAKNTIYDDWGQWIFEKDKIITEFYPMGNFPHIENWNKMFFVKDGYVYIVVNNYSTKKGLESKMAQSDFITEEKNELKIKILKSPKDKPIRN